MVFFFLFVKKLRNLHVIFKLTADKTTQNLVLVADKVYYAFTYRYCKQISILILTYTPIPCKT